MKFSYLLLFIFCLSMFNFISAEKVTVQTNTGNVGLQIFYPSYEYHQFNQSFYLHIHASNLSSGKEIMNDIANCTIHMYYKNGSHSLERNLSRDANGIDWELLISAGNFTELGQKAFRIYCNVDGIGGTAAGVFFITLTGQEPIQNAIIYQAIFVLIIFLTAFLFFYISEKMGENGMKIFFFMLGFIFLFITMLEGYMVVSLQDLINTTNVNAANVSLIIILSIILLIMFVYILIRQTINALDMFRIKRGREWVVGTGSKVGGYNTKRAY